jgi:CPA2 family monovalent cation:H+ antiporter-2
VLAIMTPDPAGVRRIVAAAREVNPTLHIVARTRFVSEIEPLAALGADEVVPEEFETSVEIFSRVLARYLVPVERILGMAAEVRAKGYRVLRGDDPMARAEGKIRADLSGVDVCAFTLAPGAPLDGKSPRAAALRKAHGVTLVAVRRDGELHANPDADFVLGPGDVAYVFGERAVLAARRNLFAAPGASPEGGADAGEKNASSPQTP